MGQPEIFVEHSREHRVQKYLRVSPRSELFVIGAGRDADLRIHGENINGIHAALRYRAPHWFLCDLSQSGNVLVDSERIIEKQIDGTLVVDIGEHRLRLFTKESNEELFKDGEATGQLAVHQVVVRRRGRVVETKLLKANEPYKAIYGEQEIHLPPPTSGKWVHTEVGQRVVQQRLVASQELLTPEKFRFDPNLKTPLAILMALAIVFIGFVSMIPKPSKPEVALDKKSIDVIFNAKAVKLKKVESAKAAMHKIRSGGNTQAPSSATPNIAQPTESTAPQAQPTKATQALNSLRQAGLSSLIGKIAKRANNNGIMVAASGAKPDNALAGTAFFNNGTTTMGGGAPSKEGATFKLGGIATKGKAGGAGDFKTGTALSGGNVGGGDVAFVDEETVVEGGLDRDAIAEVIRRNLGQVRYCYERQLSSNPDLYGKIMVKFEIEATGDVAGPKIDSTTMKNAMVEGCILRRLAGWKFPLPKGGTIVKVSYPFLFKALD